MCFCAQLIHSRDIQPAIAGCLPARPYENYKRPYLGPVVNNQQLGLIKENGL